MLARRISTAVNRLTTCAISVMMGHLGCFVNNPYAKVCFILLSYLKNVWFVWMPPSEYFSAESARFNFLRKTFRSRSVPHSFLLVFLLVFGRLPVVAEGRPRKMNSIISIE